MSLKEIESLQLASATFTVTGPSSLKIAGTIALRDPSEEIQPYLRRVHQAAVEGGLQALEVDLRELSFVNSSAMRVFVDWATRVAAEPTEKQYKLVFLSSMGVTWQKTSLPVIRMLAPSVTEVRMA